MTLAEIEKVSRALVMAAELDPDGGSATSEALARFVLAMLPVVRAAVAWSESFGELSKRLPPHVHELRRAVDEYERAIDAFRGGDK